jgi:hypothetical protein
MPAGEKGQLEPVYSSFFLRIMITTAAIPKKPATAKNAAYEVGAGSVVLYRYPVIMPIAKVLNPVTRAAIHRTQAITVARALK